MSRGAKQGHDAAFARLRLKHLQLLSLLERLGSITAAARALSLTQPAVSTMLRELETFAGTPLVRRMARGVTLEPAGRAALRRIQPALAELGAVAEEAKLAARGGNMRLRVGALALSMIDVLPRTVAQLLEGEPEARVVIVEGTIEELAAAVLAGELDCIVGRIPSSFVQTGAPQVLIQRRLMQEPLCFVSARHHALANRSAIKLATLAQQSWLLPPVKSSTRTAFVDLFLSAGLFPPEPVVESASFHSNLFMVQHTKLLAIAPRAAVINRKSPRDVRILATAHCLPAVSVSVIYRLESQTDNLLVKFIAAAQQSLQT